MILGINALGTRGGGGETVLLSLLDGLLHSPVAHQHVEKIVLFLLPPDAYAFHYPADERLDIVRCGRITDQPVLRYLWLCSRFGGVVRHHQCDFVINLNSVAGNVSVPQVMLVHNALYFAKEAEDTYKLPGVPWKQMWRSRMEMPLARSFIWHSARRVARVFVQTEVMRTWMQRDYPHTADRIRVLRPAIPDLPTRSTRDQTLSSGASAMQTCRGRRFLYIGNNCPYKNLRVVMQAARWAMENKLNWHFFLTVTGCPESAPRNVHFLGPVERGELVGVYLAADALLMPSLVETVGLPMIEAMAVGIPVVAADRAYAREICEDGALYFDPCSASALIEALQHTIDSKDCKIGHEHQRRALRKFPNAETAAEQWLENCLELTPKHRVSEKPAPAFFRRSRPPAFHKSGDVPTARPRS